MDTNDVVFGPAGARSGRCSFPADAVPDAARYLAELFGIEAEHYRRSPHLRHYHPRHRRESDWPELVRNMCTTENVRAFVRYECETLHASPPIKFAAGFVPVVVLSWALASSPTEEVTPVAAPASSHEVHQEASRGSVRTPQLEVQTVDVTTTSTAVPPTTTTSPPTTVKPRVTTTTAPPKRPALAATSGNTQTGGASFYDYKAGGCAHKTLPKGTVVTVTNLSNGKTTTCVVNDRGPYVSGRIIDLDRSVFSRIASVSSGVVRVRISW